MAGPRQLPDYSIPPTTLVRWPAMSPAMSPAPAPVPVRGKKARGLPAAGGPSGKMNGKVAGNVAGKVGGKIAFWVVALRLVVEVMV